MPLQGLHLFNLDMIREHGTRDRFYVIDINYFPGNSLSLFKLSFKLQIKNMMIYVLFAGYGKMPEYEHIFTDFLLNLAKSKYKKRSSTTSLP